jgi:hypothetical protein
MKKIWVHLLLLCWLFPALAQLPRVEIETIPYALYPEVNDEKPDLPSPFRGTDGEEYVVAITKQGAYAIMPVTLRNGRGICGLQLWMDAEDFPFYALTGIHYDPCLDTIQWITGRHVDEITRLARPGALSQGGFLAEDEDIISVLRGDNRLVERLGMMHPEMARTLFHVLNMMDEDLELDRWNMAIHEWDHIRSFFYNGQEVLVRAYDTKGGQQSIFDDGIMGAFHIQLWRELTPEEEQFLSAKYDFLSEDEFNAMKAQLTFLNTGEMQPQYIMRYGFYEGHTFWRADPIAIAFIFGWKSLEELHKTFDGRLHFYLSRHYVEEYPQ